MGDRRVLMVTYYFPPIGGIGVQRTLKHAIYLPTTGWTPVVIAPRNAIYRIMDEASATALPADLEIHRSFCYEPAHLRRQISRGVRIIAGRTQTATEGAVSKANDGLSGWRGRMNAVWARAVRLLFFPDDQLLWVPFAVRSAVSVHRRRAARVVYSSSPPVSTHLIAGWVKRRTGLPWVADFRDPWIGNSFAPRLPRFQRLLQMRIEKWIVQTADRVVFATPGLAARYRARYPSRADHFVVIPNGYDQAELARIAPALRTDDIFRLVYTGSVYGDRELVVFMDGLRVAIERRPELRSRLRVQFIGWMTDANVRIAEAYREQLSPVLELTGLLPRDEALAQLRAADAALLLLADGPDRDLFVGGKLFEYIGLDREVLAVAPPGDARQILEDLGWGILADPDPKSVAAALETLLDTPVPRRRADPEGRYERRRLAVQLGALLDEVAGS